MRKPTTIEHAYIDFDSFFASVEEQARPSLRGKAIGVIPFEHTTATCVIAANKRAKRTGVKTGMGVREARQMCPDIVLVPQSPDLYERAHRKLLLAIEREIPLDAVCSIDELCCRLEPADIADPEGLSARIKARLAAEIGPYITCSIGMAPNRQLAKIASDMNKPDGLVILRPEDLPGPLLTLPLGELPGVGGRMLKRLQRAGIHTVEALWATEPKELRALWGNVNGERFWYALHGHAVQADATVRSMYGHGRVLPPEWRDFDHAYDAARLLTVKAARRLRRAGLLARRFGLWLVGHDDKWAGETLLAEVSDDHSALTALRALWFSARKEMPSSLRIVRLHVALFDLIPPEQRQPDLFAPRDGMQEKRAKLSEVFDRLNAKYAKTIVSQGLWTPPPGGYAGGKIAYSRVPDMEDFW